MKAAVERLVSKGILERVTVKVTIGNGAARDADGMKRKPRDID